MISEHTGIALDEGLKDESKVNYEVMIIDLNILK